MIARWKLRWPLVVERGIPPCRCGFDKDDGRHLPLSECEPFGGCPDPSVHHDYRAASLRARYVKGDWPWYL